MFKNLHIHPETSIVTFEIPEGKVFLEYSFQDPEYIPEFINCILWLRFDGSDNLYLSPGLEISNIDKIFYYAAVANDDYSVDDYENLGLIIQEYDRELANRVYGLEMTRIFKRYKVI